MFCDVDGPCVSQRASQHTRCSQFLKHCYLVEHIELCYVCSQCLSYTERTRGSVPIAKITTFLIFFLVFYYLFFLFLLFIYFIYYVFYYIKDYVLWVLSSEKVNQHILSLSTLTEKTVYTKSKPGPKLSNIIGRSAPIACNLLIHLFYNVFIGAITYIIFVATWFHYVKNVTVAY